VDFSRSGGRVSPMSRPGFPSTAVCGGSSGLTVMESRCSPVSAPDTMPAPRGETYAVCPVPFSMLLPVHCSWTRPNTDLFDLARTLPHPPGQLLLDVPAGMSAPGSGASWKARPGRRPVSAIPGRLSSLPMTSASPSSGLLEQGALPLNAAGFVCLDTRASEFFGGGRSGPRHRRSAGHPSRHDTPRSPNRLIGDLATGSGSTEFAARWASHDVRLSGVPVDAPGVRGPGSPAAKP
jgi:hypothetical protein